MLAYYNLYSPPVIRGVSTIALQYSKHRHLSVTARLSLIEAVENANKSHMTLCGNGSIGSERSQRVLRLQVEQAGCSPLGYLHFYQVFKILFTICLP